MAVAEIAMFVTTALVGLTVGMQIERALWVKKLREVRREKQ